jgi:hypothetical protein
MGHQTPQQLTANVQRLFNDLLEPLAEAAMQ